MTVLTKTVTLDPGKSQPVNFQVVPTEIGLYQVSVDGLAEGFTAIEKPMPQVFYGYARTHVGEGQVGPPIPNALIQAYYEKAVFTDADGYYEIAGLPEGIYTVVCYAESHVTALARAKLESGKATEVNFKLWRETGVAEPMRPPRRIIYCGISPHTPTVLLGGQWEVISDEGYADNVFEWLKDPSIEYAFLHARHGSSMSLWLRCRESSPYYQGGIVNGLVLSSLRIKEALKGRQPFRLVSLGGCNTVDVGGSQLAYAFGGNALGQSKPFFSINPIPFWRNLASGMSAYQAYAASGADVTYAEVGLLTYYGDTRPGFKLA